MARHAVGVQQLGGSLHNTPLNLPVTDCGHIATTWKWYGVKTVYRLEPAGRPDATDKDFWGEGSLVEERGVVVRARSFSEAIQKAEREAMTYASCSKDRNSYGQRLAMRHLGDREHQLGVPEFLEVCELDDDREWVDCRIMDGEFREAGGPHMLEAIIEIFVRWTEDARKRTV